MFVAKIARVFYMCLAAITSLGVAARAQLPSATAQTDQGRVYVGGDFGAGLGIKANTLSYIDATTLADGNANGRLGFFALNKTLVGVVYQATGAKAVFSAYESYQLSSQSVGGFIRYHLKGGLFGEAAYGFGKGLEKEADDRQVLMRRFNTRHYALGMGLAHYWGKHLSLELLFRYSSATGRFDDQRALYLSGLGVTAGLAYTLGRNY